jgi:transcriptional regulator with XRE-family HTH domain
MSRRYLILKPDFETIGSRLKVARTIKDLNIPQVSEKTGISKGNLSVIENDKTKPSADALIVLSELYEVSADWILKGETEKTYKKVPSDIVPLFTGKEFKQLIKELEQEWEQGDVETKGWIVVQLRKAFPDILKRLQKEETH